ncbi:hypothetical protein E1297_03885 [Roseibium sp. RKSG952]|nr:hypothetical protein [Roseibium sp. RKSG952]
MGSAPPAGVWSGRPRPLAKPPARPPPSPAPPAFGMDIPSFPALRSSSSTSLLPRTCSRRLCCSAMDFERASAFSLASRMTFSTATWASAMARSVSSFRLRISPAIPATLGKDL